MTVGEYIYNLNPLEKGFFVDIGTFDSIIDDETSFLENKGWDGICIEGHPLLYEKLKQTRKAQVYNAFVGRTTGEDRIIVLTDPQYGGSALVDNLPASQLNFLSELDPTLHVSHVKTKKLEDILFELKAPRHINLLKIDTEGSDLEIIKSLSFGYNIDYIATELGFTNQKSEGISYLKDNNYKYMSSFNQNEIFKYEKP
jgi:FkbM family methyltransferase